MPHALSSSGLPDVIGTGRGLPATQRTRHRTAACQQRPNEKAGLIQITTTHEEVVFECRGRGPGTCSRTTRPQHHLDTLGPQCIGPHHRDRLVGRRDQPDNLVVVGRLVARGRTIGQ